MATLTLRLDDETRNEIEALARGRGETVSDFVRSAIDEVRGKEDSPSPRSGPRSLTLVERSTLASQHQILAALREEDSWEREHHLKVVEVLTSGFTGEYDTVFAGFDPEISRQECKLLWRLLDMFKMLQLSFDRLDDEAKAEVGEHAEHALSFRGFDFNDEREAKLARYARFVVGDGRWEEHEKAFEHDGGNSHSPMLATYQRMLTVYEPIWERKIRDYSMSFDERFLLNLEELKAVYAAWPHPHS